MNRGRHKRNNGRRSNKQISEIITYLRAVNTRRSMYNHYYLYLDNTLYFHRFVCDDFTGNKLIECTERVINDYAFKRKRDFMVMFMYGALVKKFIINYGRT